MGLCKSRLKYLLWGVFGSHKILHVPLYLNVRGKGKERIYSYYISLQHLSSSTAVPGCISYCSSKFSGLQRYAMFLALFKILEKKAATGKRDVCEQQQFAACLGFLLSRDVILMLLSQNWALGLFRDS